MIGRKRRKTRPQGQESLRFKQENFEGGLNQDTPATKIAGNELAVCDNLICFPDFAEGRSGSQNLLAITFPGSGAIYGWKQHPTNKKHLLHRGNKLYLSTDATAATWNEVLFNRPLGEYPTKAGDTGSQLSGNLFVGQTESNTNAGVVYWNLTNSASTRTLNIYKDAAKSNLVAQGSRSGNGTVYLSEQNNSNLRGNCTITYTGDDTDSGNTFTFTVYLSTALSFLSGSVVVAMTTNRSQIRFYKNDFLLDLSFSSSAVGHIFYINTTSGKLSLLNCDHNASSGIVQAARPYSRITNVGSKSGGTPYGRRYLYTFSRITDTSENEDPSLDRNTGILAFESPVNFKLPTSAGYTDYGEIWAANAPSISNPVAVSLLGLSKSTLHPADDAATHFTHISVYGTKDIGDTGIALGNSAEVYVWLADVDIANFQFSDSITDADITARMSADYYLKSRFLERIPEGEFPTNAGVPVGSLALTPNFLFSMSRNESKLYYSQIDTPRFLGNYNPLQFFRTKDGLNEIKESGNNIVIMCSRVTYLCNTDLYENVGTATQAVNVLRSFDVVSENIGIVDYSSIALLSNKQFIAHTSDGAIRIFDGQFWGNDLSDTKIGSILRKIPIGSVGLYSEGVYTIFYRISSSDAYNTQSLRYGFGGKNGYGWSKNTGSAFPFPALYFGAELVSDDNGIQMAMVLDYTDTKFYWIETFDGYSGAGRTKYFLDKVAAAGTGGTNVAPVIRFKELKGEEESHNVYHEESHLYLRPSATSYPSGFQVDAAGYVDGATAANETITNVPQTGDIAFWKKFGGRRIQNQYTFATSGFKIVGTDTHYQSHDTQAIGAGPASTDEATYQNSIAGSTNLKAWLCRPKTLLNRATGTNFTLSGTAPTQVTGPDGNSYALSFGAAYNYLAAESNTYTDFALCFWIKSHTVAHELLYIGASFIIKFNSNTVISIAGQTLTVDTIASGWHNFWLSRSGSTISVYQNGALKGTVTVSGNTTSAALSIGKETDFGAVIIDDVRLFSTTLTLAAIAYYYDKVVNDSGNKVLPIV